MARILAAQRQLETNPLTNAEDFRFAELRAPDGGEFRLQKALSVDVFTRALRRAKAKSISQDGMQAEILLSLPTHMLRDIYEAVCEVLLLDTGTPLDWSRELRRATFLH